MTGWRRATDADAPALTELERAANLAALGHVFPPERYPFPADDVLARWHLVLADPDAETWLAGGAKPVAFVAYDSSTLRHLAVHPDAWGTGLARAAAEMATAAIRGRGADLAELWCLVDNTRARGLYEHLGWVATADRQEAPWAPHPAEMRYTLKLS
ncbi:GNAT family N-acetyltransferase [Nocardioides speluncae]|uniref:GNAT family N-acetyltransferase n=1 Tax=Nocardioides speluncae TaxID=2670337 RepID=UPI0013794A64|nr:GNAT family N-acetyltransferase [Nocardioides speluncae]